MSHWTKAETAAAELKKHFGHLGAPALTLVLGSSLGRLCEGLEDAVKVPYTELHGFSPPTVEGHSGVFWAGKLAGRTVWMMQGRVHLYEGHDPKEVVHGLRSAILAGARRILLTNASGGCNPHFRPGDLMCIADHINLTGTNALLGTNDDTYGPRFPDMSTLWTPELRSLIVQSAAGAQVRLRVGIYAGMLGPSYETPAEIRMLQQVGADAVGMSTVLEAIAAGHMGAEVGGISVVTNVAAGLSNEAISHEDVSRVGQLAWRDLMAVVEQLVGKLA